MQLHSCSEIDVFVANRSIQPYLLGLEPWMRVMRSMREETPFIRRRGKVVAP